MRGTILRTLPTFADCSHHFQATVANLPRQRVSAAPSVHMPRCLEHGRRQITRCRFRSTACGSTVSQSFLKARFSNDHSLRASAVVSRPLGAQGGPRHGHMQALHCPCTAHALQGRHGHCMHVQRNATQIAQLHSRVPLREECSNQPCVLRSQQDTVSSSHMCKDQAPGAATILVYCCPGRHVGHLAGSCHISHVT